MIIIGTGVRATSFIVVLPKSFSESTLRVGVPKKITSQPDDSIYFKIFSLGRPQVTLILISVPVGTV